MQIRYIDGNRLKRALIAGSHRLMDRAARLNAINVFPVPDGDTGTNMAGTARTMVLALQGASPSGVGATVRMAADSALRGARGNSGAILAQFLHGLAEELKDEARVTTRRFAAAARAAAHRTYQALSQPREGTILTVLKDWAEAAHRLSERTDDFLVLLRGALEEARASLARTTELLPELKKSGLPDAGAEGVVHILEGIMAFIHRGRIRDLARSRGAGRTEAGGAASADGGAEGFADEAAPGAGAFDHGESAFRYCTECMAVGEGMDLGALRAGLESLGDSVVVAGSPSLAKIHLHTDEPTKAFRLIERHGEIEGQKVDDMELQRRLSARPRAAAALLADSACDLAGELGLELLVERVPVRVELGGKGYLDRDGLSSEEFYAMLRADPGLAASTSQPAPAAFQRKLDLLLGNADEAVYVGLSAALSGTLEAGRRAAAEGSRAGRVRVVDSRSISVGAALVVRGAAEAAAAGAGAAEVEALAGRLAARSRLFVAVPDLAGLIRSGRLGGVKGLAARSLGLRPLITIDAEGRAVSGGLYLGKHKGVKALVAALRKALPAGARLEAMIGHADAPEEAARLALVLEDNFELEREIVITPVSPALAAHAGLGALALAFLLPETPAAPATGAAAGAADGAGGAA